MSVHAESVQPSLALGIFLFIGSSMYAEKT